MRLGFKHIAFDIVVFITLPLAAENFASLKNFAVPLFGLYRSPSKSIKRAAFKISS